MRAKSCLSQCTMLKAVLMTLLGVSGVASTSNHVRLTEASFAAEPCPPCEQFFSKLKRTGTVGKLGQDIRLQVRGEPKSGTGVMYSWATAAMLRTCDYLQELYGQGSCRYGGQIEDFDDDEMLARRRKRMIVFEPALGGSDARCSCDTIDRVSIVVSNSGKHRLPVGNACAYSRGGGLMIGQDQVDGKPRSPPCTFVDGTGAKNNGDLWRCMHEADCEITDPWIQMAMFRDPRPAVVSTFYHVMVHSERSITDLDAFVLRELPIMCQWLALRYMLFTGSLADQSVELWYNDAMVNPLGWHHNWLYSIGLQLPFHFVEDMARAAAADNLGFSHKKIDVHPGEEPRKETTVARRFEDEVSPEVFVLADEVLRTWLPPELLERFGVVP